MTDRVELNIEDLDNITGGTVKAVYSKDTKIGIVTSNMVEGTWTFAPEHKGDVMMYIASHTMGYADQAVIDGMSQWLTKIE